MSKEKSEQRRPAGRWRGCLGVAAALLLAGCAAKTAFTEGQELLAAEQVDAGLARIKDAIALEPSSAEYRIAYARALDRDVNANLAIAERALIELRHATAENAYQRVLVLQPGNERALAVHDLVV